MASNLAGIQQQLTNLNNQIEQLQSYQSEFRIPDKKPSIVIDAVLFSQRLGTSIAELQARVPVLNEEISRVSTKWREARSRRRALEKLIDRQQLQTARQHRITENNKAESWISLKHFTEQ